MNLFKNKLGRVSLKTKKNSPEILLGVALITGIGCTVTACMATLKADQVLDEAKNDILKINEAVAIEEENSHKENYVVKYSEQDYKKDLATVKIRTGLKIARLYLPAVALGVVSAKCMFKSHNILNARNAGLAAAYAAVRKSYDAYRQRVIEAEGDAKDREYKYGITTEKVKETVVDPETGKKKTVKKTNVNVPTDMSEYGVWFSPNTSNQFSSAPGYNKAFLKGRETFWNHILLTRGHVFLNEILQDLGMQHTQAGAVVGWIVDKNGDPIVNPELAEMVVSTLAFSIIHTLTRMSIT